MNNLIFGLDPGSIRSGWAILDYREQLIEAGSMYGKTKADPEFRISAMCHDLRQLLSKWQPKTIVIEITSGKVGRKRHTGCGSGLAVYGMAVGSLWQICEAWRFSLPIEQQFDVKILLIRENDWTRQVPKEDRNAAIAAMFTEYKIQDDPGGDVADAIGLGLWFLHEQIVRLAELVK
jgi:hypothetical protein